MQEYRIQIARLKEQVKIKDERLVCEQDLYRDKVHTLETHIKMLQEDNKRLVISIKKRKE